MNIRNIVFDLGNVIVDLDYSASFSRFGIDIGLFNEIYDTDLFRDFERGKINENSFFDFFCSVTGFLPENIQALKASMHLCFPLRTKVWDLLFLLKDKYRIFLLSNTNVLDFSSIENILDIRAPFEKVYLSYEQGYRKPDVETYAHAETVLDISPRETLFLDDRPENLDGAAARGWNTAHILSEEHVFSTLALWSIIPAK